MATKKHRFKLSKDEKLFIKDIGRFLFSLMVVGSIIALIAIAPNALIMTKLFLDKNPKHKQKKKEVQRVFGKMFKNKLIRTILQDGKEYVEITDRGKKELVELDIDTISIKKQKWDGKFRLVIFDIPEEKKIARGVLRDKLREIGFLKVQKSVWAAPYECEREISYITSIYGIEKFTNYIVAEKADFSEYLIKYFNLK